jgi:hypothetical protein
MERRAIPSTDIATKLGFFELGDFRNATGNILAKRLRLRSGDGKVVVFDHRPQSVRLRPEIEGREPFDKRR